MRTRIEDFDRYEASANLAASASRSSVWWSWRLVALMASGERLLAAGHAFTRRGVDRRVDRAWRRFSVEPPVHLRDRQR